MSRCFPYLPPGYCRDGATTSEALIESIKLQKENDKAKAKAERKREKREKKEKKPKDKNKRKDENKVMSQNQPNEHQHDLNKLLQKATEFTAVDSKKFELKTEHLERSDVTEEHGQPHKPSYSSDTSTQNSNKRKRDDASLSDVATGHGKPIKIRLLKKQKESDSSQDTNRPSVPFASNCVNETSVSQNRTGVPVTSGRENNGLNMLETNSHDSNVLHFDRKQLAVTSARLNAPPCSQLTNQTPIGHLTKTEVPVALRSIKSDEDVFHHRSYQRPVLTQCQPSTVISGPNTTLRSGTGKLSTSEISVPVENGPTISEKKTDPIIDVPLKVAPTRHEKKMLKKQSKYEKLVGCWVPQIVEAQLPVDEDDWFSRRVGTVKSSSWNDVETCRQSTASSSIWQPCAQFLVEADMHALPYTVPF